jgi:hypothetical protein
MSAEPVIKKGRWEAPKVVPQWLEGHDDGVRAPQVQGGQLPDVIQPADYDLREYWDNVEQVLRAATSETVKNDMDVDEEVDGQGVPLPPRPPAANGDDPAKPKRPVWEVFLEQVSAIEEGFVPMGMINPNGNLFKFVMPPGHMGEQIERRIKHIFGLVLSSASARYYGQSEQLAVVSNVLPCPVHVSPLALIMIRDRTHCNRYTDAITVLLRLHVLRLCLLNLDTEKPEHKAVCKKLYARIEEHARLRHYKVCSFILLVCGVILNALDKKEVDRLCAWEKEAPSRARSEETARLFGQSAWQYALDLIHAAEWCCLDIMGIPYEWRHLFMTPNDRPLGEQLSPASFATMWKHLCLYVGNRNQMYCSVVVEEIVDGVKRKVYKDDPTALNPMQLANPPLADRPQLLGQWNAGIDPALASRCLFGIFAGWCDLHTLREYMHLLEQDPRTKTVLPKKDNIETPQEAAARIAELDTGAQAMDVVQDNDDAPVITITDDNE